MSTNLLISTFAPFPTYALSVPSDALVSDVPALLAAREPLLPLAQLRLSHPSAQLRPSTRISSLGGGFVTLRLAPAVLGGKGGFGSQLRAAGGRMSSRKTGNTDSCRDLSGRRLSTLKEAKKLAEYMEAEPDRKKAAADARKAKLAALEKKLGIDPKNPHAAPADELPQVGQKRRFDDTKFLEETQELVEGVRDAVAAGLLKKRKKAKTDAAASAAEAPSSSSAAATITNAVVESAATAPVALAASVAVGIASA